MMELISMSNYFVKDGKIHSYPVPMDCDVVYNGEKLYDYITDIPAGNEMCFACSTSLDGIFIDSMNKLTSSTVDFMSEQVEKMFREKIEEPEG